MKKTILVGLLASCCIIGQAQAQTGFGGMFPGPGTPHSSGAAFSGIGDVYSTSAQEYWGLRAWNAAKATAGVAAINLCNVALCGDVHVTSAGGLNASDVSANGCNLVDTCVAPTIYGQIGTIGNMTASGTARATFKNNCLPGGLPCLVGNGSTTIYTVPNVLNIPCCTFSFVTAATRTGNTSSISVTVDYLSSGSGDPLELFFNNSTNNAGFFSGGGGWPIVAANDNSWHAMVGVADASLPVLTVDTSSGTGPNGSSNDMDGTGAFSLFMRPLLLDQPLTGNIYENVVYLSNPNSTQTSNIISNMRSWGGY